MSIITTTIYDSPGEHVWSWPDGETEAFVEVWGGDAGGGNPSAEDGGAGGSAGGYASATVTKAAPATTLVAMVGDGGGPEEAGTDSFVTQNGDAVAYATGASASNGLVPGVPGYGAFGTTLFSGGSGGSNDLILGGEPPEQAGAGGGARASRNGDGQDGERGLGYLHGQGGHTIGGKGNGGDGGEGAHDDVPATNGEDGSEDGGGGGGGGNGATSGSGHQGKVRIVCPPPKRGARCCCIPPIACDDGTFDDCFTGKCLTINGAVGPCGPYEDAGGICGHGCTVVYPFGGPATPCDVPYLYEAVWSLNTGGLYDGAVIWAAAYYCNLLNVSYPGSSCTVYQYALYGDDARAAINSFCQSGSVTLPFDTSFILDDGPHTPPPECDAPESITLELVECASPKSYDCVSGTCTDPHDGTGAYSTLLECQTSGCAAPPATYNCTVRVCTDPGDGSGYFASVGDCVAGCPPVPASYNCIAGTCTDPLDGTGTYSSVDACVTGGCAAPDCDGLDDCMVTMSMSVEIDWFIYCSGGSGDYVTTSPRQNFNGLYLLESVSVGAGSYLFRQVLTGTGDYEEAVETGSLWYTEVNTVTHHHVEWYVYKVEIQVVCAGGRTSINVMQFYYQQFEWDEPNAPAHTGGGSDTFSSPSGTLEGTAGNCASTYMESHFPWTDCLGDPRSVRVLTGGIS